MPDVAVFFSGSGDDEPRIRTLAQRLSADGVSISFHDWKSESSKANDQSAVKIREAHKFLICWSQHYYWSRPYWSNEWATLAELLKTGTSQDMRNRLRILRSDQRDLHEALRCCAIDWPNADTEYSEVLKFCQPSPSITTPLSETSLAPLVNFIQESGPQSRLLARFLRWWNGLPGISIRD